MKQFDGYKKKDLTADDILLANGGNKDLGDFIGSLYWNSETKTLQIRSAKTNTYSNLITFGDRAFDSTAYLPLSGGTVTGALTVKQYILGYNYNHAGGNAPAFVFDKPGSNYTGIGANGEANTIYFSAATLSNGEASWVTSYKQKWKFNGTVTSDTFYGSLEGNATTATDADTVDSEHASAFAHRAAANNLVHHENEITMIPDSFSGSLWFNYQSVGRNSSANITGYTFGNGKGGSLASITSGTFNGNCTGSAGSVAWTNVSSKPTTLSGYGITDGFYSTQVGSAQNNVTWAINQAKTTRRAFIYNTSGTEWSYLFGLSSSNISVNNENCAAYGVILKMTYADKYLRMIRVYGGKWYKTDGTQNATAGATDGVDWEKIYAGYADSAGSATIASQVKDAGNDTAITFKYSTGGFTTNPSWLGAWNGYQLTYVSPSVLSVNYATSAGNADTVDNVHANQLTPCRYNNRFYPFVKADDSRSIWHKVTLPWAGYTSGSNAWMMTSMELVLGGAYSNNNMGRIYLQYYFVKDTSNVWAVGQVQGVSIGSRIIDNGITIKYNIANPGIMYVKVNNNIYNSFAIENLSANDTAPSFDFRNTTITAIAEGDIPAAASSTVPIYHTITTQNYSSYCAQTSHNHDSSYVKREGDDVTGHYTFRGRIFGYNYNNQGSNAAAFMLDKPGSYLTGMGPNGVSNQIHFGPCNAEGTWVSGFSQRWDFQGDVYAANYYTTSDARKKQNIHKISDNIKQFEWKETGETSYGFVAQDLEINHPELVDSSGEYKTVNYNSALSYYMAQLENRVKELENEIKLLKKGKEDNK